jgi:hypothetical protein
MGTFSVLSVAIALGAAGACGALPLVPGVDAARAVVTPRLGLRSEVLSCSRGQRRAMVLYQARVLRPFSVWATLAKQATLKYMIVKFAST